MKFRIKDILYEYEQVQNSIIHIERGDSFYRLIFKVDNKFYETNYVWNYNYGFPDDEEEKECREVYPEGLLYVYELSTKRNPSGSNMTEVSPTI